MEKPLRILIVEDNPDDAELLIQALGRESYDVRARQVADDGGLRLALIEEEWDIIFCDWVLPGFGGSAALDVYKASRRDIPFVILSGMIDEETAVGAMRAGADDFLLKNNLVRLGPVVARELAEAADRKLRREAERALKAREAILTAVGSAAERLIRSSSWETAVGEVLARIGPAAGASRILVYANRALRKGHEGVLRLYWYADEEAPPDTTGDVSVLPWTQLTPAWDLAVARGGMAFTNRDPRFQAPALGWMARHDVGSLCLVPIRSGTDWWGAIVVLDRDERAWSGSEISALRVLADALGASIERTDLLSALTRSHSQLAEAYDGTLEGWALALELRDQETAGHTRRVADMTIRLARAMGIEEEPLIHIRRGALLHDIGKMGVPDSILFKPGPLTEAERDVMRLHPIHAHNLLKTIPYLHPALDIPYAHHERWDGTGYPCGLAAEEIPIAARIFAVVDAWDAMRSDRPYRQALAAGAAVAEMEACTGTHFDPAVVEVFLELVRQEGTPRIEDAIESV